MLAPWSTGFPVYRSTGLQVFRSTGLPVYRFSGLQVFRPTGLPVYRVPNPARHQSKTATTPF
ncbi:MAG: hypothetical protein GY759_00690 [Chloroflexi bacterium]|nr:hypothetical protein [Chloroflexota bacterium]